MVNKILTEYSIIDYFDKKISSEKYILKLYLSLDNIFFSIINRADNSIIAVEKYILKDIFNFDELADIIDEFINNNVYLNSDFFNSEAYIYTHKYTFFPKRHFTEDITSNIFKINHNIENNEDVLIDVIDKPDIICIYSIPAKLVNVIKQNFKNIGFRHFSSSFINYDLNINKNKSGKNISIYFNNFNFEILITENSKVIFYNSFKFITPDDIIYYLLFVFEQLLIDAKEAIINVFGNSSNINDIIENIKKYAGKVELIKNKGIYNYSDRFNDINNQLTVL